MDAAFVLAVVAILAFAFTNGFHDAANAIATLVATRGARPGPAIILAAVCNMLGPLLLGAAVADTIAGIVQVTPAQTVVVVGAALTAAVIWNLVTWRWGLPYFSSLANLAGQLVEGGAGGLVLFNRFYQPDLDIETMEVLPALELSSSAELRLSLRWIAILHRRWGISLAASTGVHTAEDVVKVLLAGADVAMMTSALLHNGPDHLRRVEVGLRDWMDRHRYETVDQLRGRLSQRSVPDPAAFERANYIKTLASRTAPRR